jgi:hypothetical protein
MIFGTMESRSQNVLPALRAVFIVRGVVALGFGFHTHADTFDECLARRITLAPSDVHLPWRVRSGMGALPYSRFGECGQTVYDR